MSSTKKIIILPKSSPFNLNLYELYQYRELLWTFTYRDFRARYAQTAIGILWVVLNPLLAVLILSFIFGIVARVELPVVDGYPVPGIIYCMAGMCGWQYFSTVLTYGGDSVVNVQGMVKKIYFPRLILPLSKALTALVEFGITILILFLFMLAYQFPVSGNIFFLPIFLIIAIISGLTGGIMASALTIRYRDFQHVTPLIVRLGMYATPIAYPASLVPEKYLFLYYLNPMAGVVEGFRWSIIGGVPPNSYAYLSFAIIFLMFIISLFYFKKVESTMADLL